MLSTSKPSKPFDKILIANRGEIACRVIKTARKMGVKTVAIYSDVDASSMHVKLADEAYCVGGAASRDSYLRMEKIIEVALASGAQAIHPGYGFLSENAKFVDLCESSGIAFIGPSAKAMNDMGDKINSKKIAKAAGCFVIPGYEGEVQDEDQVARLALEVGYPVMIKASAGGGGKGMRVAYNDAEVREGFFLSKAEAMASFGDDRMLIERYIEDPHHIEIQVVADSFGNVLAFPERECSVQRRNQKVIEESPSCLLTPETRRLMQEQAIMLCKATGYKSAGTIEMLADGKQNFFFLEMNTRLQVEHPVTELVSGQDLVEHMLWVAAGYPLPKDLVDQVFLPATGWAVESRVYAEDPLRGFLPSIGPLVTYVEPPLKVPSGSGDDGVTVRIDTGVFEGANISIHYDPMISKLCTHAETRDKAIIAMESALDQYVVSGLGNNIPFLRSVYRKKSFRDGDYGTKFIAEQYPKGFFGVELQDHEKHQLLASAVSIHLAKNNIDPSSHMDDLIVILGNNGTDKTEYKIKINKQEVGHTEEYLNPKMTVDIQPLLSTTSSATGKGARVALSALCWHKGRPLARLLSSTTVQGEKSITAELTLQYEGMSTCGQGFHLRLNGSQQMVTIRSPLEHALSIHMLPMEVKDDSKYLLCPMPGTLISLGVSEGQFVEAGQQLAVVEAMKMQNVLRAAKAGTIKKVYSKAGSHLKVDQIIIEFESNDIEVKV